MTKLFCILKKDTNMKNLQRKKFETRLIEYSMNWMIKKISVKRYPLNKLSSEKFYKIIVNHDNIADFFNKRTIYQWDLQHLTFDLKELKEKIKSITKKIRYKNRWLAAFDYFLVHA